jgi:2-isopropylmalate synthase
MRCKKPVAAPTSTSSRKVSATSAHLVQELAGTSNVREVAQGMGIDFEKGSPEARKVLAQVKKLESEGYEFEGAEASFHLLVQARAGKKPEAV